jgi:outer membrane protein OmpA-like peptidoglycan-associated protein
MSSRETNMQKTLPLILASFFIVLTGCSLAGCSSALPPKELIDARTAYDRAKDGIAKELAPADLDTAKQSLRKAEQAFQDDPESQKTKDLSYVAHRKALLAEIDAQIEEADRKRAQLEKDYQTLRDSELERQRLALENGKAALNKSQAELDAEKKAREEAEKARLLAEKDKADLEKQLQAALKSLKEIAEISEEKRGVVITLSGGVLFITGKFDLLPIAKDKLNQVAAALKDQGYPPIRIEGHTDNVGSAEDNKKLSQQRADSVKDQLVSQGYPASKITTVGWGAEHPVADNGSPEGRANNRRVEIIVNPK